MLNSITTSGLNLSNILICAAMSIVLGLIIALVNKKTANYSKNFAMTLAILPILVQVVVMMVNGNLGTGVAILGAFSLVRFRSIPGTSREIMSVFFAMSVGLATGTGFIWFAAMITAIVSALIIAFDYLKIFDSNSSSQTLKITMPEDINHDEAFAAVFEKYKVPATLERIKTKNMGSLFELTYIVTLLDSTDRKKFINDLRVRNGNLAISLFESKLEEGL